jgi:predicted esterase YcpF (UPF0227 family)
MPIVFYFHGYNSTPNSGKVDRLREHFPNTFAYPIDIDQDKSVGWLMNQIFLEFLDFINDEKSKVVFVGTSLGAWYAAKMAEVYKVKDCILINPCYSPRSMLQKYGVPQDILEKYSDMTFAEDYKYFIAKDDDVIDFNPVLDTLGNMDVTWTETGMHRFNGPEFDQVIEYIKNL